MSDAAPSVEKLQKQLRMLRKKLERSEWHRADLENQHDRDQHLYRRLHTDLEAARREAEIEAALERVRSRAMAMRSSDELREMVLVILKEMKALAFPSGRCTVVLFDRETGDAQFWMSGLTDDDLPERYHVPYHDLPTYKALHDGWRQGTPFFEIELAGEVKREQDRFFHEETEFSRLPEPAKEGMRRMDDLWLSNATTTHGVVQAVGAEPLPKENAAILQRFATVIDLTYTRVEDIQQSEAQVREAQIEAALERIRAQSLRMAHSSELVATSAVFHEQLLGLGIPTEFSYVWLPEEAAGKHQFWATWTDDDDGESVSRSRALTYDLDKEEPYTAACFAAWASDDPVHVEAIPPGDVEGFFDTWAELLQGAEHLRAERFPDGVTYAEAYMAYGCFGINIRRAPTAEEQDVLLRFAVEFERAYTRFLDLQRAEAQAREAEVEAALERVRSRTMGMQSSDELGAISFELVKQVQALGVDTWHCAFNVYDEGQESSTEWGANADGYYPTYHTPRVGVFRRYYEIGQSGTDLHVEEIGDDRCADHYDQLCTLPGVGDVLLRLKDEGVPFPTSQVDHVAYFKYGYLIFITYEPAPVAHDIFRRFAKVFEQTYTRFLDLKQAEAQAREARIETALERVRSQAMGMQSSDELQDVIQVVRDQIASLEIHADHAGFIMDYKNREDMHIWLADENEVPTEVFIPYFDSPHWNSLLEAQANEENQFVNQLDFETKNKFYNDLFGIVPGVPDKAREFYLRCPGLSISTVLLDDVGLYIENFSARPYTDEENRTLMRFGNVFQQAYTRFLDLQRAEQQAREAEIELALERVRARTMAMQQSAEISEVALVLYQQLQHLGAELWGTGFAFCTRDSDADEFWFVNPGGILPPVAIPNTDDAVHRAMHEGWRQRQTLYTAEAGGAALEAHYAYMLTVPDVHGFFHGMLDAGLSFPSWQKWHAAYFSHGYLLVITLEPFEEERVLTRFAKAFEQAYVRFLDLQQSEARAREAQIEAALERVRSRALAMTTSDDLLDVVFKIHQEYSGLGLECGVFWQTRYTPESYHKAVTSIEGERVATIMELPRDFSMVPELAAWEHGNEKIGVFKFDPDAAASYVHHMITKGHFHQVDPDGITEEKARDMGGLTFVQARTSHGEIGYSLAGETEPTEEAKDVLVRFASAFDLAYRRFLDLQKAEADHLALLQEKALTERALVELRATQNQLVQKEKMASLGALTAGIAHEIKNPLNFVTNFAALSRELVDELAEVDDPAERDEILTDLRANAEKIEEHGRRADGIVRSMMAHARSGSGERRAVDLNALVAEYTAHAEHAMRVRHPAFEALLALRLGDGVGEVDFVPEEIGRVLVNLVDNALDATRQRAEAGEVGYAPTVTVSTAQTAGGAEVRVEDNGPGMPEAVRAKVFEPFFTTKPAGQGTGLGLSLSHDIVAQGHGGTLAVESAEGEGTTFTLRLPTGDRP